MHAGLLVAHRYVGKIGILLQSLPDAGDVAVPENSQHAGEKGMLLSIPLNVLVL